MTRMLAAFALCLLSAVLAFGQDRTPPPPTQSTTPIQPGATIPAPPTPSTIPPGATPIVPYFPAPPTPLPPTTIVPAPSVQFPRTAPFALIPSPPGGAVPTQMREHYAVAAKVELSDGTTLAGELHSDGPLECRALYGPAMIPWNQIKGIEWRNVSDEQGGQERKATLILVNGDALTVSVTVQAIQLKTTWGESKVELAHVRSILMTVEKVKWTDAPDGRRMLVPDKDTPDANEQNTTPRRT